MTDRAPRPEGMRRPPMSKADIVGVAEAYRAGLLDDRVGDLIAQINYLDGLVSRLRADGATLRERVRKLPTPVNPERLGTPEQWYCRWCGAGWPLYQTDEHPDNGCLWFDVHKEASAPKEPTP